jgi:hypothetical protein
MCMHRSYPIMIKLKASPGPLIGDMPICEGHPQYEQARSRAISRKLLGSAADALKSEEELFAEELLSLQICKTEQAAKVNASRQLAEAHLRGTLEGNSPSTAIVRRGTPLKRQRVDLLTPSIREAQSSCKDRSSTAEVWEALKSMARKGNPPFIGVTENGLKYSTESDEIEFFTRKNLLDRLRR